jgi:16S rRNA G527 N7-methylase RsmG
MREWEIENQIGIVISDNMFFNDNYLQTFYQDINVKMGLTDIRARRMRYYRHMLNLVACAFLYREDFKVLEAEL